MGPISSRLSPLKILQFYGSATSKPPVRIYSLPMTQSHILSTTALLISIICPFSLIAGSKAELHISPLIPLPLPTSPGIAGALLNKKLSAAVFVGDIKEAVSWFMHSCPKRHSLLSALTWNHLSQQQSFPKGTRQKLTSLVASHGPSTKANPGVKFFGEFEFLTRQFFHLIFI